MRKNGFGETCLLPFCVMKGGCVLAENTGVFIFKSRTSERQLANVYCFAKIIISSAMTENITFFKIKKKLDMSHLGHK